MKVLIVHKLQILMIILLLHWIQVVIITKAAVTSKNNPIIENNPAYCTSGGPSLSDNPAYKE